MVLKLKMNLTVILDIYVDIHSVNIITYQVHGDIYKIDWNQ